MPTRTYELEAPASDAAAPCRYVSLFEDGRVAGGVIFALSAFTRATHPRNAAYEAAKAAGERWIAGEAKCAARAPALLNGLY